MLWEGINVNLKATNMDLTDPIHDYVIKRVTNLGKILSKVQNKGEEVLVNFEVAKTTNHHKGGQVYKADGNVTINGKNFYASSEEEDMYAAIDDVKEKLFREIENNKERNQTLYKRGATKVKNILKGLTGRK